ncbi:hypothetical protein [Rhabdothermincola salaria]|uniref:hypothetical protein n=1 Tax=Rhabdothermincola salaria TaxID=2903142 RepID=UPI001E32BD57|nr:hypothetical protein [Rhabdothermincola salaria]MCD9623531.1 hypothetical protein [Rhabdothermincola salaria]
MDTARHTTQDATEAAASREVAGLRSRATSLRHQADALDDVLAVTYRRRASELEMEAWILEVQFGLTVTEAHPSAA